MNVNISTRNGYLEKELISVKKILIILLITGFWKSSPQLFTLLICKITYFIVYCGIRIQHN